MNETEYTNKRLKPIFLNLGCKFKKHHQGLYSKGWPDIEVRWKGLTLNIEVKFKDVAVTKLQRQELKDIARHGGYSFVFRYKGGVEYLLGIDEKSQILVLEIGAEFERMEPGRKFVYDMNESAELEEQYKKIMEG
jgi:hypothetical protein